MTRPIPAEPASSSSGRLVSAGLRAVSAMYSAALHLHLLGYRLGVARRTRLPATVISIGNLTVGGTGKTTAAVAVARWLWESGRRVGVLSRGYRGRGERGAVVVSEGFGPLVTAEVAGDEPFLIARTLPNVYVLVGKDRRRTGRMAVEQYHLNTLVLDDGFQYQRLCRDVDIVLVDALQPFGHPLSADDTARLLPAGRLREPPHHLVRADAVWLTHCDLVRREDLDELRRRLRTLTPHARLWETVHAPVVLRRADDDTVLPPSELRGRRVCALSALGNPLSFERTLARLGAEIVSNARFPDHHPFSEQELREVVAAAGRAEWLVTTAKDAVRLPAVELSKPIWVLEVELASYRSETDLGEEMRCLLTAAGRE